MKHIRVKLKTSKRAPYNKNGLYTGQFGIYTVYGRRDFPGCQLSTWTIGLDDAELKWKLSSTASCWKRIKINGIDYNAQIQNDCENEPELVLYAIADLLSVNLDTTDPGHVTDKITS